MLGLSERQVPLVAPFIGGGFGPKGLRERSAAVDSNPQPISAPCPSLPQRRSQHRVDRSVYDPEQWRAAWSSRRRLTQRPDAPSYRETRPGSLYGPDCTAACASTRGRSRPRCRILSLHSGYCGVTDGKTPSEYIFSELSQVADLAWSAFHRLARPPRIADHCVLGPSDPRLSSGPIISIRLSRIDWLCSAKRA